MSALAASPVEFTLDGRSVQAREGESLLQCAQRHGIEIPHLCFQDGLRPDGNCRACVVDIQGERVLAPSCCRSATPGMQVQTGSPRARAAQRMVLELLLADAPATAQRPDSELLQWAQHLGVQASRFAPRTPIGPDV